MIIGIDFDGTCVTHAYPAVGEDIGAVPVLRALVNEGHKLILITMRDKDKLQDAVNWFEEREIPLYGVNNNKQQRFWTSSKKIFAHLYIDDAGLGIPLETDLTKSDRPYVCWEEVRSMLITNGILKA